jgi:hypothetical protein
MSAIVKTTYVFKKKTSTHTAFYTWLRDGQSLLTTYPSRVMVTSLKTFKVLRWIPKIQGRLSARGCKFNLTKQYSAEITGVE